MRVNLLFASLVACFFNSIVVFLELMSKQTFLSEHIFQFIRLIQANSFNFFQTAIDADSFAILLAVLFPKLKMVIFIINETQHFWTVIKLF